ncbi:MAG: hypothetical protein OEQ12_04315 [Nitrosopumilus sp.]|nr:hypothetical protein [Nitrosopumilus sp.]
MLLEFLAQNLPKTKALMLFDSFGKLNEQKISANLEINDDEIIQNIIANSKSLINLVTGNESLGFSEHQLILLGENIVVVRRLDQNKVPVLLLSHLITQESKILQYNNFVN